jgi:hypothetical protein
MIGVFRPRPTAFVHDWFTLSGGRQVADSEVENKSIPMDWYAGLGELGGDCRLLARWRHVPIRPQKWSSLSETYDAKVQRYLNPRPSGYEGDRNEA